MPPAPTPSQAAALLRQAPLNSPIIEIFLNGIFTCLLLLSLGIIWMSKKRNYRRKFWTALIVMMYSCSTIHSSCTWEIVVLAFQNHGTSPDLLNALSQPHLNLRILGLVASFLGFVLADAVMVWRCWIVWGRSWVVIVFPILAAVAATVCAGLGLAGQIAVVSIQNSTATARLVPLVHFSTPFLSLSLAVTLYTTGLIAWRIIQVQRYAKKHNIKTVDGNLFPVLEILVESSALYSLSLFVFVVLLAMKSPNQNYPQNIHVQIAGIAPTLLIFRITIGYARKDEEWTSPRSKLEFAHTTETSQHGDHSTYGVGVEGNTGVNG